MNKIFLSATLFVLAINGNSQNANFETPVLTSETAWYGQDQVIDGDTIYLSDSYIFELNYNSTWGSYTGWAVSNITDNTTPGWANQYSAIPGSGASGSSQYGVGYIASFANDRVLFSDGYILNYAEITNTTYAYYSMLDGDAFAKPFGADTSATGVIDGTNGEDWFLLTIYSLAADSTKIGDSVNFYLADYRFSDDTQDYIVDTWQNVDLTTLGLCYGLDFSLSSSDTSGGFGMNTPSYFSMDNLVAVILGVEEYRTENISVYPNPTQGPVIVENEINSEFYLYDLNGKLIRYEQISENNVTWDLSGLENGVYLLVSISNGEIRKQKLIKQ